MGKNKLKKFNDMATMDCVFQYPFGVLKESGFPIKGSWRRDYFHNDNPIVLELGCGKGEYTVGLAERYPDRNFIGIDIKGARMWTGACQVRERGMKNAAFLRTNIELLPYFFAPDEVDEIWITFPDPQMKKTRRRLTSARFLKLYRRILAPGGTVHLKTDSPFLYTFTSRLVHENSLPLLAETSDLYSSGLADAVTSIKTHYEKQWLSRGKRIKLIEFTLPADGPLADPQEDDIEHDDYTSFPRGLAQCMPEQLAALND